MKRAFRNFSRAHLYFFAARSAAETARVTPTRLGWTNNSEATLLADSSWFFHTPSGQVVHAPKNLSCAHCRPRGSVQTRRFFWLE